MMGFESQSALGTGIDTVADYVSAAVTPHVADQLITPEALADIQHIAGQLPGAMTDFFGFECALGTERAAADFLICCRVSHGAREFLAGRGPGLNLPSAFQEESIWRRVLTFCEEWARPESPLYHAVHNLWFEFDVDGTRRSVPVPSVFIGSDQLRFFPPRADPRSMPSECAWLADLALPMLGGREIAVPVRRQLARCINLLPSGARLFQVGLMLARNSQTLRLCVRGIATRYVAAYLEALGWEGDGMEMEDLLDSLQENLERIDLDLDITDHVLPKIGLECYGGMKEPRCGPLLADLVSSELCTVRKAEAIARWAGTVHEGPTPEAWPRELMAASRQLGGRLQSTFVRKLHHVKVDFRAAAPVQAKAYLGVHHKWLTK